MQKYHCPIIHLSPEGDRCGAAGLRRGYVQVTVTYDGLIQPPPQSPGGV